MILSKCFDVEVLPNFFSITFIDLRDYLKVFADCVSVDSKGKSKPIPITECISVREIKERLNSVKCDAFYITDTDNSQLFPLIEYIQKLAPRQENDVVYTTDLFGYNSKAYDNLMVAAFLANCFRFDNTKDLIRCLYFISKRVIDSQNDRSYGKNDFILTMLRKFKLPYRGIDVFKIFALNKASVAVDSNTGERKPIPKGLKQVSINLKWYNLLEYDMPPICDKDYELYSKFELENGTKPYKGYTIEQLNNVIKPFDRYIIDEYIPDMMYYNKNDVFIVAEIARLFPDEIKLRYSLSHSYKVDVLNSSRSNIADTLFTKFYSERSGLHPSQWQGQQTVRTKMSFKKVIFDSIVFKTPYMQEYLNRIKNVIVTRTNKDSFEETIQIGNLKYTMATGGLHSQDPPRALYSKHEYVIDSSTGVQTQTLTADSYTYEHYDIASFYPSIMAEYEIAPKHLNSYVFANLVRWLRDTRVEAKHSKEEFINGIPPKLLAEALKIVINSIYGKFGFEAGDLFDRMATLRVTINGQLMVLMLCEELEMNGIEVVSANTDGIVIKLYERDRALFNEIAQRWLKQTKLKADSEQYRCYINRDINNYLLQELNGKIDYKGAFNPKMYLRDLSKGYDMPIVAQAVENYFLYNKPVMQTLQESKDILDFCKSTNVGRQFHVEETRIENGEVVTTELQRYVRYYVSNTGTIVKKVHNENNTENQLAAGQVVTVLNQLDDVDISLRDINYRYYWYEAQKMIQPIVLGIESKGKGKTRIRKAFGMQNSLFD